MKTPKKKQRISSNTFVKTQDEYLIANMKIQFIMTALRSGSLVIKMYRKYTINKSQF